MKKNKNKIFYVVMGGIGNQLFQFANAYAFGKQNDYDIYAEKKYAFVSNIKFKRRYKLNYLINNTKTVNLKNQINIFIFFLLKKVGINYLYNLYLEFDHKRYKPLEITTNANNLLLIGYWQSEKYFLNYSKDINSKISLPKKGTVKFNYLLDLINNSNAVAVCVRVYDEMSNDKSFVGGEEQIDFYNKGFEFINKKINNPKFFIFAQKKYDFLEKINSKSLCHFIIADDIDFDEIYNLNLIVHCKYHLISNSSYYWWGAWLSEKRNISKLIIASKKFSNKDCIPSRWTVI